MMKSKEQSLITGLENSIEEHLRKIFKQFEEYLETTEAQIHLSRWELEIKEVQELMDKLSIMDRKSPEFTELVLYGLLPYSDTKFAKRVSMAPVFMNIKTFFKNYTYSNEEWSLIANRIFDLANGFRNDPNHLPNLIAEFTKDKYSRRLQCGSITPILFCINNSFPLVNNRTIKAYRGINTVLGEKDSLSHELVEYNKNIEKLKKLVDHLGHDILKNHAKLDMFCFWYDSKILSNERVGKDEDSDEGETGLETEEAVKSREEEFRNLIERKELGK